MFDKMYKASIRNVNKVLSQEPVVPGFITSPKRNKTPNRRLQLNIADLKMTVEELSSAVDSKSAQIQKLKNNQKVKKIDSLNVELANVKDECARLRKMSAQPTAMLTSSPQGQTETVKHLNSAFTQDLNSKVLDNKSISIDLAATAAVATNNAKEKEYLVVINNLKKENETLVNQNANKNEQIENDRVQAKTDAEDIKRLQAAFEEIKQLLLRTEEQQKSELEKLAVAKDGQINEIRNEVQIQINKIREDLQDEHQIDDNQLKLISQITLNGN